MEDEHISSFASATDPTAAAMALEAEKAEAEGRRPAIAVKSLETGELEVSAEDKAVIASHPALLSEDDSMAKLAAATGINDIAALKAIIEAATSSLNASHKAEITALRTEIENVRLEGRDRGKVEDLNESMGGYPWMYYKIPQTFPDKQRRGWITMGPGGASPKDGHRDTGSFALYLKKGFIPITEHGLCPVPTSSNVADTYVDFVRRGGAGKFPASQIVAYQWHKRNPFAGMGVRWAQLDGILDKLQSFTCEYCGFSLDFMPDDPTVGTAYRIHLINADKVTFKEAIEAVRAAGLTTTPFKNRTIEEISQLNRP